MLLKKPEFLVILADPNHRDAGTPIQLQYFTDDHEFCTDNVDLVFAVQASGAHNALQANSSISRGLRCAHVAIGAHVAIDQCAGVAMRYLAPVPYPTWGIRGNGPVRSDALSKDSAARVAKAAPRPIAAGTATATALARATQ